MRADLQGSPTYKPPGSQYLNLANNENFNATWLSIIGDTMDEILEDVPFHQYGPSSYEHLIRAYANYAGVTPEQVLPAPGSDSLIPLLISTLSERAVVTFDTDFFRYGQFAKVFQRTHVRVPIAEGAAGLIEAANAHQAELIMFSNPNNPLGITQDRSALVTLLEHVDAYVVIDEAYAEYHGESMVDLVATYPKLLVMRTLSKGWGLARLRVGFLIADPLVIQYLNAIRGPFILSDLNANIATAVLGYAHLMRASVEKTIEAREKFLAFIQAQGLKAHPSGANFVYIEVPDAKAIAAGALDDGIALAVFGEHGLRITIGTEAQMTELEQSLAKHLSRVK